MVSTMTGVNDELWPYVRTTSPRSIDALDATSIVPGAVVLHSWLLAGGIIPFDRHVLTLVSVVDGEGFVEDSTSWLQRRWRHERMLAVHGAGCVVTDRLLVVPRIAWARPVVARAVRIVFAHRHRRLVRRFGAGA